MATIRLKFRPSSSPQTLGTLCYQVIHRRSVRLIDTGCRISADEWDAASSALLVPTAGRRRHEVLLMQSAVRHGLEQRRSLIRRWECEGRVFTIDDLCHAFAQMPPGVTVFTFLQEQVAVARRMQRHGTARTYDNACRRFREFRGGTDLAFDALTPDIMERYEAWLSARRLRQNTSDSICARSTPYYIRLWMPDFSLPPWLCSAECVCRL